MKLIDLVSGDKGDKSRSSFKQKKWWNTVQYNTSRGLSNPAIQNLSRAKRAKCEIGIRLYPMYSRVSTSLNEKTTKSEYA